jgi:ATP-dependent DNA helicase RecG
MLVMTATPIPRSLCLTQFGDLDLTVVSDLPPGRQKVVTSRIYGQTSKKRCWDFIRQKLKEGRQLYVVSPRIEGGSDDGQQGAEQIFRDLPRNELAGFRVGLVHGQMDLTERARTMADFREGELQALVATTVIEVGVDVPNATLMVILEASAAWPRRPREVPRVLLPGLRGRHP